MNKWLKENYCPLPTASKKFYRCSCHTNANIGEHGKMVELSHFKFLAVCQPCLKKNRRIKKKKQRHEEKGHGQWTSWCAVRCCPFSRLPGTLAAEGSWPSPFQELLLTPAQEELAYNIKGQQQSPTPRLSLEHLWRVTHLQNVPLATKAPIICHLLPQLVLFRSPLCKWQYRWKTPPKTHCTQIHMSASASRKEPRHRTATVT